MRRRTRGPRMQARGKEEGITRQPSEALRGEIGVVTADCHGLK